MSYKRKIHEIDVKELIDNVLSEKIAIYRNIALVNEEELITFCKEIGTMLAWDFGYVMHLKVKEDAKNYLFTTNHVPYHWDGAFHKEPQILIFYCLASPEIQEGGETLFCNTEMLLQECSLNDRDIYGSIRLRYKTEKLSHYGGITEADLIQFHPITGNTILRFAEAVDYQELNPVSVEVVNASNKVPSGWQQHLIQKLYDPRYCYTHSWKAGDLIVVDNFSLLHARNAYKKGSERHLLRAQVLTIYDKWLPEEK